MGAPDFTPEEEREFRDVFAEIDLACERLKEAARILKARGYRKRAHGVLNAAQLADGQKYLLVGDWREKET